MGGWAEGKGLGVGYDWYCCRFCATDNLKEKRWKSGDRMVRLCFILCSALCFCFSVSVMPFDLVVAGALIQTSEFGSAKAAEKGFEAIFRPPVLKPQAPLRPLHLFPGLLLLHFVPIGDDNRA